MIAAEQVFKAGTRGHSPSTQSLLSSTALSRLCRVGVAAVTLALAASAFEAGTAHAQNVYVPTFGTDAVSVYDSATNTQVGSPIPVGISPTSVMVTADQSFAYVLNFNSASVSFVDTANNTVVATVPTGSLTPAAGVLSPDGRTIYVVSFSDDSVSVIDVATQTLKTTIPVGNHPQSLAITPDGKRLYVPGQFDNSITVIDTATNTTMSTITTGSHPSAIAISPDGTTAYVAGDTGVTPVNILTNTAAPTIPLGISNASAILVSADGKTVYVANFNQGRVAVFDVATRSVSQITVGAGPVGMVLAPDGRHLYVSNQNNDTVTVIDTTDRSTSTISTAQFPNTPGMCGNGNALLAAGRTFVAKQSNALGCTGALAMFTGGTLQIANTGVVSTQPILLGSAGGIVDTNGFDATLNGTIAGTGGLTKIGAGVLTLGGASNYTGPTLVNVGVLAAGAANVFSAHSAYTVASGAVLSLGSFDQTIGSLAGAGTVVLGSATLTAGADNTSTTFSGEIAGGGGLIKTGTGTMTLSNTNTYVGATTVDGGTLRVNSNVMFTSGVTVNATGTLAGSGHLNAVQVNTGGTFAPGDGTPGSSMSVGSLAFLSGAQYMVSLDPSTSSFAKVVGTASLGGATVVANFVGNSGYAEKRYTILTADNTTLTDTFASTVVNNGGQPAFKGSLAYDDHHVYLDLALNLVQSSNNQNQTNVANAITNFFNNGNSIPVTVGNLTPNGLTQVSGELGTGAQQTTFQAMNLFMGLITDPFSAGRGVAHNGPTAFADDSESMAYAGRAKAKNPNDAFAAFTKAPPAIFAQRWNVWAAGYGGSQTTDGNAVTGSNNTTSAVYGGVAGADYWFSPDTVAGFALAGGGSNFSVTDGGSGRSDMFQAGAFVRHNFDATYVTASVAYGWQDVTTDRYVSVAGLDHLRANFNANAYSGRLELGHRFLTPWFGGLGVSPYAAAQITAFELPSYAERAISGASTFALNYGADTATSSRTELGLRSDKSYALDGAVLTLRGRAAWAHDFNPDRAIAATFQTLPGASFVVNGAALASDSALTTASAEVRWMNGWSVAGTFEGEFSNVTRSYAGKGVVRYNW